MFLEFFRGRPNKWFQKLKDVFDCKFDTENYEYFQYVLDCYTLESEYRPLIYSFSCNNGVRMTLTECVEFIKNTVIPDIISLQKRYYRAYDLLHKHGYAIENNFKLFSVCWNDIKYEKKRSVMMLEALMHGKITRGNYNISFLFETFDVSVKNACKIAQQYCLYARENVENIEYILVEKGLNNV